ncbi:MAG: hypothetical protein HQ581_22445 [Planctomycetes bacterium]|nr:hypothetical protein [Planctomycetota bacterium]
MCDESCQQDLESLPLPKDWTANLRHAVLNVIGIVRIAMLSGREFLIQEDKPHVAQVHRLETEVAMLREELRINGARTRRIDPHQRPQYLPTERMAILELRAMRGWSKAETARRFFVSDDTIRAWLRRADDDSLIQTRTPVNRFPDFVRYVVQRIELFCPTLGKVKIADKLARAGIHIGKTTVQRILKKKPAKEPEPSDETGKQSRIVAKYAGHTMHADLTTVPISGGGELPLALCVVVTRGDTGSHLFTVHREEAPLVTCGLAVDEEQVAEVWPLSVGMAYHLKLPRPRRAPPVPWLCVVTSPGLALADRITAMAVADLERCLAWAILEAA